MGVSPLKKEEVWSFQERGINPPHSPTSRDGTGDKDPGEEFMEKVTCEL